MYIHNEISFLNETARRARKTRTDALSNPSKRQSGKEQAVLDAEVIREEEERQFWLRNRTALRDLGNDMPMWSGRRTFSNAGCVAALSAIIAEGDHTREGILSAAWATYRYSHRHAGFMLGRLCGDDATRNLWFRDEARIYHLHQTVPASDLKLAA